MSLYGGDCEYSASVTLFLVCAVDGALIYYRSAFIIDSSDRIASLLFSSTSNR